MQPYLSGVEKAIKGLGLEKLGEGPVSPMDMFVSGIDPFGLWTSDYGYQSQRAGISPGAHRLNAGLNLTGGVIGGAAVLPTVIGGIAGGVRGLSGGKGGILKGIAQGAKDPWLGVLHGNRGLRYLKKGGPMASGERSSLNYIMEKTPVGEAVSGAGGRASPWRIEREFAQGALSPETRATMEPAVRAAYTSGLSQLGMGGAVGGLGAGMQYRAGRQMHEKYGQP